MVNEKTAPVEAPPAVQLAVFHHDALERTIPLANGEYLAGSDEGSDILLSGDGVLPRQLRFVKEPEVLLVFNLGQPGDVQVRQRPIRSTVVDLDDEVEVGSYRLKFEKTSAKESEQDVISLKRAIYHELLDKMDLKKVRVEQLADRELWSRCGLIVDGIMKRFELPPEVDAKKLKEEVLNEALALGPLQDLLAEELVTEIMVNGPEDIFVERKGKLEKTDYSFTSSEQILSIIQRIVSAVGRRVDESSPMVDARLKDGSRVNAIIPPLALNGPTITIRKFSDKVLNLEELIQFGSLTAGMGEFLQRSVELRKNIIISGGTGSGKTSLLNILSAFIPANERVITIEDSAELRLPHENLCSLEARPANIEGKGAVEIRDLVRNALRMRPDRIVVGECRGGEAIDMLQAMNTGHDGSLTTLHANSPDDAILRLETMVMMSGLELPHIVIRREIAAAVHVIVQQARMSDGTRKVIAIVEVEGMEGDEMKFKPVYLFNRKGLGRDGTVLGDYEATGYEPSYIQHPEMMGMKALPHFQEDLAKAKGAAS